MRKLDLNKGQRIMVAVVTISLFTLLEVYLWQSKMFLYSYGDSFVVLDDLGEGIKRGTVLFALIAVYISFAFHVLRWFFAPLHSRHRLFRLLLSSSRLIDLLAGVIVVVAIFI